jgi:uncharacterized membrane protein YozB (DUF420 family)
VGPDHKVLSRESSLQAGLVILILKIAVVAVTFLLAGSLVALWRGKVRLHGRINMVFFALTLTALLGLEVVARILEPEIFDIYFKDRRTALNIHLGFSMPSALLLPFMLYTGLTHRRKLHIGLACVFLVLWTGTFVTGVFFLPHD